MDAIFFFLQWICLGKGMRRDTAHRAPSILQATAACKGAQGLRWIGDDELWVRVVAWSGSSMGARPSSIQRGSSDVGFAQRESGSWMACVVRAGL